MKIKTIILCLVVSGCNYFTPPDWIYTSFGDPDKTIEVYVSTTGNDNNPGTLELPFRTLEKARNYIREKRANSTIPFPGAAVWLRGGNYERPDETFYLEEQDGYSIYSAYSNEDVHIMGAIKINPSAFVPVTEPSIIARLDSSAYGHVVQLNLSTYTTDYGDRIPNNPGLELYYNRQLMQLARWPDTGFALATAPMVGQGDDKTFFYSGERPARWGSSEDIWLQGFWKYPWASSFIRTNPNNINSVQHSITAIATPPYGIGLIDASWHLPYYAINMLEEITQPGEWYLNRSTGILYFWPPGVLTESEIYVSKGEYTPLVVVSGAQGIIFSEITFEINRNTLVNVSGSDISFNNCVFRNGGSQGIIIHGLNNVVNHSKVYNIGRTGIVMYGGSRANLEQGHNAVLNTEIYNVGRWLITATPAILLANPESYNANDSCGNIIAHNEIHHTPHYSILVAGNNHLIEYNKIYNVSTLAIDSGAIYSGRDWGFRGNVIRYNLIKDVASSLPGFDGVTRATYGVYLDDCVSGFTVTGNIINNIDGYCVVSSGGRDNHITNNVIVGCTSAAFYTDNRGLYYIHKDNSDWDLLAKITAYNYKGITWSTAYPELAAIPSDLPDNEDNWRRPEGCIFSRNIGYNNGSWIFHRNYDQYTQYSPLDALLSFSDISNNIENQDPLFVNPDSGDYSLSPQSPVFSIPGFEEIPYNEIGLEY